MKLTTLVLFFVLFAVRAGATTLSGGIYSNTTWTLSGSPYVMTGNVVVFGGATLTIEPGVVISVDTGVKFEVRGQIIAKGTASKNITFKGNTTGSGRTFWAGIFFVGTTGRTGVGPQANFEYCNLSNARCGLDFTVAFYPPYIFRNCNFTYNYSACEHGGIKGMLFDSCTIMHNTHGLVSGGKIINCTFDDNFFGVEQSDTLINCTFTNHFNTAIQPYGYTKGCTITDNRIAVHCYFNSVNNTFIDNIVMNNTEGIDMISWFNGSINFRGNKICNNTNYNIRLNTKNDCNLSNNCWCGADSATIRSTIIDGYVDIRKGLVTIGTISSGCGTGFSDPEFSADISVHPNPSPANTWLNIRCRASIVPSDIGLVDVLGKKYSIEAYRIGDKMYSIKLPECGPGIYFVIIPATENNGRFVKQVQIL